MSEFVAQIRAELDMADAQKSFEAFKKQIESQKIKLQADPNSFNQILNNPAFKASAKNTGKLFSDSLGDAIKNVSSKKIEAPFIATKYESNDFKQEIESWVRSAQKDIDGAISIDVKTNTRYDKNLDANVERLNQAVVKYKTKSGETISKIIREGKIGIDNDGKAIMGFVEVSANYSKSLDEASAKTDNFAEKQKKAAASLRRSLESESKAYESQAVPKPIKDEAHLNDLRDKYTEVENAIHNMEAASKDGFTDAEIEARRLLSSLKDMAKEYRNIEYAATSLRTKDFQTVKDIQKEKALEFQEKFRGEGIVPFDTENIGEEIDALFGQAGNITNQTELVSFLNTMDKLEAKYKRLKEKIKSDNAIEKLGIKKSGLASELENLQKLNGDSINDFTAQINNADVSIQSLRNDLEAVDSPSAFSVVNEKAKAFIKSAKAAGFQIREVHSAAKESIKDVSEGIENRRFDSILSNMEKQMKGYSGQDPEKFADIKEANRLMENYSNALGNLKSHYGGQSILDMDSLNNYTEEILGIPEKFRNTMTLIRNNPDLNFSQKIADIESNFKPIEDSFKDIQEKVKQNKNLLGEAGFDKLTGIIGEAEAAQSRYNSELSKADAGNIEKIKASMKDVSRLTAQAQKEYAKLANPASAIDQQNEFNKWTKWAKDNPVAISAGKQTWDSLMGAFNGSLTEGQFKDAKTNLNAFRLEMEASGKVGHSFFAEIGRGFKQIGQFAVTYGVLQKIPDAISKAVTELKGMDDILTEISKTSDMTDAQLKQLGNDAFGSASEYGRTASDYLLGVQEMSRSGFYGEKATDLAELSILGQAAGDMTADVSNAYLLATNAAYKYAGSAEKLNAVLDGQNMISNRNSVSMTDMAAATSEAASMAAETGVAVNELSALIGTMESRTKSGGAEVGNSLKSILVNLQNVSSSKIVDTLDKAGASMTEYVNGAKKLRNPIDILRDLAKTYNELDENDPLKSEITTNIGQKFHANKLAALLKGWDDYEKMLKDYSEGGGSAAIEAEKSANNWSGSINRLSNSWSDLVGNLANSDVITGAINLLDSLISGVDNLSESLGFLGTIGGVGGALLGAKGIGKLS